MSSLIVVNYVFETGYETSIIAKKVSVFIERIFIFINYQKS